MNEKTMLLLGGGVLIAIIFFAFYGKETVEIDKAVAIGIPFGALILLSLLSVVYLEHATPKFIANNLHSSTDGHYENAGDYIIVRLGAIDSSGFHTKGGDGCVVVPRDSVTKVGLNMVSTCAVHKVNSDALPHDAQVKIYQEGIGAPYWLGVFNEEQELNQPDAMKMKHHNEQLNEENTMLRTLLREKGKTIEEVLERLKRMKELTEGGVSDKIGKAIGILGGKNQ